MENAIPLSQCSFGFKIRYFVSFLLKTIILFSIFIFLLLIKLIFSDGSYDSMINIGLVVLIFSLVYLLYYLISECILQKMIKDLIGGLVLSLIGSIISVIIPIVGCILLIFGFLMMIKQIIDLLKLLPMFFLGAFLTFLLFDVEMVEFLNEIPKIKFNISFISNKINNDFNINFPNTIYLSICNCIYVIFSFFISVNLAFKYRLKDALFRQTIIFMSIPIIIIIFVIIGMIAGRIADSFSSSVFTPSEIQTSSVNDGKIWVNAYTRADGTPVSGHFRSLPKT